MSHTTKASDGTVFIHNGDYSGDVTVIPVSFPERVSTPDDSIKFSVDIPFADLRELVFAYLWDRGGPAADPHRAGNTPDVLRKGQVVKFRRGGRTEYMRLLMDASESTTTMSLGLVLYGYRTRADGSPTHVRPVARCLSAGQVEIVVTPGEEARSALHCGTSRDGLSPAAQAEYDRLLALVMRENPEIGSGD